MSLKTPVISLFAPHPELYVHEGFAYRMCEFYTISSPVKSFRHTSYADKYNVSRSALSRRHRGVSRSRADFTADKQSLAPDQELELIRYITKLTKQGLLMRGSLGDANIILSYLVATNVGDNQAEEGR
jgi:hypothetical protein